MTKNFVATALFVDFSKAFDSILSKIFLRMISPMKTGTAIMILNKNTKIKVRLPDGDTDFFEIIAGVHLPDIWATYLFIIMIEYILRTSIYLMKENGFTLRKKKKKKKGARSSRYTAQTITDASYSDDIVLLVNTSTEAESLLLNLEQGAVALSPIWIQTKRNTCILFKITSPL